MTDAVCGWCGKPTYMAPVLREPLVNAQELGGFATDAAYQCANCHRLSVVTWWTTYDPSDSYRSGEPESYDSQQWSPTHVRGQRFPDVPDHIASAASEAYRCDSIGAYRGAVAIARAVVEASCKAHEAVGSDLSKKINDLFERRLLREHIKEAAHEVRFLGNEVAHGDFITPVTEEESDEVLGLMAEILRELFQSPAEVARRKAAREAKG